MAALGLRCHSRAFSNCSEQGLLFPVVCGLLFPVVCGLLFPVVYGLLFPVVCGLLTVAEHKL